MGKQLEDQGRGDLGEQEGEEGVRHHFEGATSFLNSSPSFPHLIGRIADDDVKVAQIRLAKVANDNLQLLLF